MEYIETIRLDAGHFRLLEYHQRRMAATIREVYGDGCAVPVIADALAKIAEVPDVGVHKCRVLYDTDIRRIEIQPYRPRIVRSLRLVEGDANLDYHLKSADRSALEYLAAQRGDCDEVIIVRDGLVTDTSYSNLVFHSPERMFTPRCPLLKGVMRSSLVEQGVLQEIDLRPCDILPGNRLRIYAISLINALLPLSSVTIPVDAVRHERDHIIHEF